MPNRDSPGSNVSLAVMLVGDKYWQKSTFNTHIMLIKTYHTVPFFKLQNALLTSSDNRILYYRKIIVFNQTGHETDCRYNIS